MYYNNTIMKIICDWNNCNKIGEYKAPIEKDNSKDFRYLCLEHIREFNKNWNYFANMTDNQINEFIKRFWFNIFKNVIFAQFFFLYYKYRRLIDFFHMIFFF